jgi:hypothetical protein
MLISSHLLLSTFSDEETETVSSWEVVQSYRAAAEAWVQTHYV